MLKHRLGHGVTDVERLDAVLLARLAVEHFKTAQEGVPWDADAIEDPLDLPQSQLVLSLMEAPAATTDGPGSSIPGLLASLLPAHIDEAMLTGLYARFQRNNHVLVSPDAALRPFANAVLARVSRAVNHSCLPSAVVTTTWAEGRPRVGVRIIQALAAKEEVRWASFEKSCAVVLTLRSLRLSHSLGDHFVSRPAACALDSQEVAPRAVWIHLRLLVLRHPSLARRRSSPAAVT